MNIKRAHSGAQELLESLRYCVIDLETTGGNPKDDEIIEIGLVKIDGQKITDKLGLLINPNREIPEFIQKLTGIYQDDVAKAPFVKDVLPQIEDFIEDRILVAHNTSFDIPFLNGILEKYGRPPKANPVLCTNVMTKHLIPEIMNSNLTYMCELFQIEHKKAHRAIEDAIATAKLLLRYLQIFCTKEIRKPNQLYYPRNKFELDRRLFSDKSGKDEILEVLSSVTSPLFLVFKGEEGNLLTAAPFRSFQEDSVVLEKLIEEIPWKSLTVKQSGPYWECLLKFSALFGKGFGDYQTLVVDKILEHQKAESFDDAISVDEYDFLFFPHLIRGQVVAYPLSGHGQKLVFKLPVHRKRLLSFLSSKSKAAPNKFLKKFPDELAALFSNALRKAQSEGVVFPIKNAKSAVSQSKEFFADLEAFSRHNADRFRFPANYL